MTEPDRLNFMEFTSPAGPILVCVGNEGVCLLHIGETGEFSKTDSTRFVMGLRRPWVVDPRAHLGLLDRVKNAILDYFEKHIPLPNIPVDLRNGSAFQQEVWQALQQVPFGETRTYLQIATSIGRPKSARAVGQACGSNPVALIIPCHRVLASNGKLGGFSSGLHIKKALLELEQSGSR